MDNFKKRILTKAMLGISFAMGGAAFQLYDSYVWVSRGIMAVFLVGLHVIANCIHKD